MTGAGVVRVTLLKMRLYGSMKVKVRLCDNRKMKLPLFSKLVMSLSLLTTTGCWPLISNNVVARVSSPDGRLDAILFEKNGGATTSFGYVVEIGESGRRHGKKAAELYGAVRNANAYGVDLRWADARTLVVECLSTEEPAKVEPSVEVDGNAVKVLLHTGIANKNAPDGGMLYNLQHR